MRYFTLLWMILTQILLFGQGDICTAATAITCGSTATGNTSLFMWDNPPFCAIPSGTGGAVWYRFTGTGATVTASLCGSSYDTGIRIFSGACNTLPCIGGNDNFCGVQSQVTWSSVVGTTYYILISGAGTASGAYTLSLTCVMPPTPMCYSQTTIPYNADPYAGTNVVLSDDIHSGVIPIGFNFCYNGNTYSQCVISSNNYITFNLTNAGTYSSFVTNAVPSTTPTTIQNAILNPWHDTYPPAGGFIRYQTLGIAPNRRFVVSFLNVPMFSCTSMLVTNQTVLYEGTNCIAMYTLNKPLCLSSNSGNAVHALQNQDGTSATIVPGRNNAQWTATSQGILFSPTCAPCSTSVTSQCLGITLPVEMIKLNGYNLGSENIIEWATASERESDYFILERKNENGDFDQISTVNAAGNSSSVLEYTSKDRFPIRGINYYRIRTVDVDGQFDISDVISVNFTNESISFYPNPAGDVLHYSLRGDVQLPLEIFIVDISGRLVMHQFLRDRNGFIQMNEMTNGIFFIKVPAATNDPLRISIYR